MMLMSEFAEGYDQLDYEMVVTGNGNYEIPVSTAAEYRMESEVDASVVKSVLEESGYTFVAPNTQGVGLSSKVYDSDMNEFFHITVKKGSVFIFPKSDDLSEETFVGVVETINDEVVGLELVIDDE